MRDLDREYKRQQQQQYQQQQYSDLQLRHEIETVSATVKTLDVMQTAKVRILVAFNFDF